MNFLNALTLFVAGACGLLLWLDSAHQEFVRLRCRDLDRRARRLEREGLRFVQEAAECREQGFSNLAALANKGAQSCFCQRAEVDQAVRRLKEW